MKNISYTHLVILFLFTLCCLSCKDEEIDGPLCCGGPPVYLYLHIADIEGVGTSEKERKDFLSKVSMYYFSKTGVKKTVPLTGGRGQTTSIEFLEVKEMLLIKEKEQNDCKFNLKNCLSVGAFPLETFWKKKIERLYLQIRQDVDTIDLTVKYNQGSYMKHEVTNFQVNGKSLHSPDIISSVDEDGYDFEYYFSKAGKKPKVVCPSE